jgi:hypothetical protein
MRLIDFAAWKIRPGDIKAAGFDGVVAYVSESRPAGWSSTRLVAQEVSEDAFSIAGGAAGMKVSWQLTGIRDDAWAQANPLAVEQDKPEDEKGFFLSPEVFGHDLTRHTQYKRYQQLIEAYPRQAEQVMRTYAAGIKSRSAPG